MYPSIIARSYAFLKFTFKNYIENECTHRASSLTITTLLTMVPLLTILFSLLTHLPYFDQLLEPVQNFIFNHFVPDASHKVQAYVTAFTTKASHFSIISGIAILLYSMLLIYNVELALNKIWHVKRMRNPFHAVFVYGFILIILPLFLGFSLFASSYLRCSAFFGSQYFQEKNILISHAPFVLAWIGFSFLYYVVPNKRVPLKLALFSALLATLLFEVVKKGFSLYLTYFTFYEMIYGAFAIVPVFIIWIELVWLITLFGAEFNHSLNTFY